jgi:hypothetical protein
MSKPKTENRKKILEKKYYSLRKRLEKEDPKIMKQVDTFFGELREMWIKISPFVGEEEGWGRSQIYINPEQEMKGLPLDFILWFNLFKMISAKFDEEFKWFRENRKILEMMMKEYLEAQKFR